MKITKEQIMKLVRQQPAPPPFRELMRLMGVDKARRPSLKALVDEMVSNGLLFRLKGNRYALAETSGASGAIKGKLSAHPDGYGFVTPEDGSGEDIFIPARYLRENLHGDRVEVQIVSEGKFGKREGRIIKTLERANSTIVGRYEAGNGFGYLMPDEKRITQDVYIPQSAAGLARSGQTVVAEITRWPAARRKAEGRIVEVLGWPDEPEVEVQSIIRKYELPHEFPPDTLKEARSVHQQISEAELVGRTDLRELTVVTIDGETAKDFDDAVAVRREGDSIRLWVSIADVSHYVKPGSPLDREAYLRGTSVYFPDRCLPMLPEELSNGICSLNPQVDRLTMTAELLIDSAGVTTQASFYPSIINSSARLTYTTVSAILEKKEPAIREAHASLIADLEVMEELALYLMAKRRQRGSIDFDLPEPEVVLDLQGKTEAIVRAERNLAHRIIEEFMLAANEAVACFVTEQAIPFLYRVHEQPDPVKLNDFREFIFNFGYEFRLTEDRVEPSELQRLLQLAEGKPEERMINQVLLRCMKQARYTAENLGHFGLAAPCYTHFTSPIRRYPDLVVHRILKGVLGNKYKRKEIERLEETLPETASHTSGRERVAMEAEREIVELKKVQFMRDKVGEEFDAFITGVTSSGFFVELIELFVEGMVHVTTLPSDFYRYLEKQHSLVGERSREAFRIGDKVRVKVANVSLERKRIDFVLAGVHVARTTTEAAVETEEYPRVPVRGKRPKPAQKKERETDGSRRKSSGSQRGKRGRR